MGFNSAFKGLKKITYYITPKPRDLDVSATDSSSRYSDVRDGFIRPNYSQAYRLCCTWHSVPDTSLLNTLSLLHTAVILSDNVGSAPDLFICRSFKSIHC